MRDKSNMKQVKHNILENEEGKLLRLYGPVYVAAKLNQETRVMQLIQYDGADKHLALAGAIAGGHNALETMLIQRYSANLKEAFRVEVRLNEEDKAIKIYLKMKDAPRRSFSAALDAVCVAVENDHKAILMKIIQMRTLEESCVDFLLVKYGIEKASERGNTALVLPLINLLVDKKEVVQVAISKASSCNHEVLTMELISQHGADINVAVRCAAGYEHTALVMKLIKMGADKNIAVEAAAGGSFTNLELVIQLIEMGADINRAIDEAIRCNNEDIRVALIRLSASKNKPVSLPTSGTSKSFFGLFSCCSSSNNGVASKTGDTCKKNTL